MKNLFVHIGLQKTGSSFLQNRIFNNLSHINYLGKTESSYHQWMIDWHYLDDYAFKNEQANIQARIEKLTNGHNRSLISSEVFTMYGGMASAQLDRLKLVAPDSRIIMVLRDPIDRILSFYKYNIMAEGFFMPLEEIIDWHRTPYVFYKRKPVFLPDFFHNEIIEVCEANFDSSNTCILKYEEMHDAKGPFWAALAEFLQTEIPLDLITDALTTPVNPSPDSTDITEIRRQNLHNHILSIRPELELPAQEIEQSKEIINSELRTRLEKAFKGKCDGYH